MKHKLKNVLLIFFTVLLSVGAFMMSGCGKKKKEVAEFYDYAVQAQERLDTAAEDIYTLWYNYIYGEVDFDILYDLSIEDIKARRETVKNDYSTMATLYKKAKDNYVSEETKRVISAYNEYYEIVINVSGNFRNYSANISSCKQELDSAMRDLELSME